MRRGGVPALSRQWAGLLLAFSGGWDGKVSVRGHEPGWFVQQLAVSYVTRGYRFYVTGHVPERKDPRTVDEKLVDRYGIDVSEIRAVEAEARGRAILHYIRFGRFFVLIATAGKHRFDEDEGGSIRDCGRVPIRSGATPSA